MTNDAAPNGCWRELHANADTSATASRSLVSRLAEHCIKAAGSLPGQGLYRGVKRGLLRVGLQPIAGRCDLERIHRGKVTDREIRGFSKVLAIRKGYYDYEYFNVCFLNNVAVLCMKAFCEGFLPRVEICNSKGENLWESFFDQPFPDISTEGKKVLVYDEKALEAFPLWDDIYDPRRRHEFIELYARFAILNSEAKHYVQSETDTLLPGRKVLGVLCRGTDYTATKPKGHPIQPEREQIIAKVREVFHSGAYEYVYLATEDSKYDALFRSEYGDRLLINRRNYYDKVFSEGELKLIKDVHFDRENDDYLKGLEYISSLQILANCDGLVAGNCGGTQAVVFWNGGKYREAHVFDGGLY